MNELTNSERLADIEKHVHIHALLGSENRYTENKVERWKISFSEKSAGGCYKSGVIKLSWPTTQIRHFVQNAIR